MSKGTVWRFKLIIYGHGKMILQKALTGQCNRGVKLMHGVLNTVKSSSWVSLTQRSQTLSFRWHCQVMAVIIMTSGSLYSGNQTKKCTRQPVLELKNHIFKKLIIYGYIFHSSDNARWAKQRTFELDIFAKSKPYSKHLQLSQWLCRHRFFAKSKNFAKPFWSAYMEHTLLDFAVFDW